MKRSIILAVLAAVAIVWIGCSSPAQEAQKMFAAGQYEQLVAKYSADPNLAGVVQQAKDKIAERLFTEQKFDSVMMLYPTSPLAGQAKNKLAERAFMMGNYQEVMVKYADTPWAMQAKMKMDSMMNAANPANPGQPGKPGTTQPGTTNPPKTGANAQAEAAAQAALDNVMKIQIKPRLKSALQEFINNPAYAGTNAVNKAKAELAKIQ